MCTVSCVGLAASYTLNFALSASRTTLTSGQRYQAKLMYILQDWRTLVLMALNECGLDIAKCLEARDFQSVINE